jgi:transcriptional regulator with XRE-family HTH domain
MALHISADLLFEESLAHRAGRRTFGARLDHCLKRNNISSSQAAKRVGVAVEEVAYWRAGITAPARSAYRRLSRMLDVDVSWLCLGIETEGSDTRIL